VKSFSLKLTQKFWLLISFGIVVAVLVSYGLTQYVYEKLYVQKMEASLTYQGQRIAALYKGGGLSPTFRAEVERFNFVSEAEVFVTENPRQLGACLPFEVDYNALITQEERDQLVAGRSVKKIGYENRFQRKIMAVIVPLRAHDRLEGIIYLYVPLATIDDAFSEVRYVLLISGILFILFALYVGKQLVNRLTKPLRQMEQVAGEMAHGNFKQTFAVTSNDEVGSLGRALNHMADALNQVDEQRKEFLANISHELRTPLSYIKGYSEAMIEGVADTPELRERYVQLIHREAGRMERLVHDLLDLAQLEGSSYPLHIMPLPLAQLIEDTLRKFEPFLAEKRARLIMDLNPDVIVEGDHDRLEQVIHNVCDNALRHLPEEHGRLEIVLRSEPEYNRCLICITDNGTGIPSQELKRLGERFYRVDKARNRKHGGSGLGLSIVKQIVHLHQGTFAIESELGKGTTVSISLPLYPFYFTGKKYK
jgi:signal transduction histidine kinase